MNQTKRKFLLMSPMNTYVLVISFCLTLSIHCQSENMRKINLPEQLKWELKRKHTLQLNKNKLQNIHNVSVWQKVNGQLVPSTICKAQSPKIQFQQIQQLYTNFEEDARKPVLIYKYEEMQYNQQIIDMHLQQNRVYLMTKQGQATVIDIDKQQSNKQPVVSKIDTLRPGETLFKGNFLKVGDHVLYVDRKKMYIVTKQNTIKILQGFSPSQVEFNVFSAVMNLTGNYLSIVVNSGIYFYKLIAQQNRVQLVSRITLKSLGVYYRQQMSYSVTYWDKQDVFLMVSIYNGLQQLKLSVKDIDDNDRTQVEQINMTDRKKELLNITYCNDIKLNRLGQQLFLICQDDIIKISLSNWPEIVQENYEHPGFSVKQLHAYGPLTVYIGKQTFKVNHKGQTVMFPWQYNTYNYLLLKQNYYVLSDARKIKMGYYNIIPPKINCQIHDPSFLGPHIISYSLIAKCQNQKEGKTKQQQCQFVYDQKINVWEQGQISYQNIVFTLLFLLSAFLIAGGFILYKTAKLRSLRKSYDSLEENDNQLSDSVQDIHKNKELQ